MRTFQKLFASLVCLALALSLFIHNSSACSWDYSIWMNRSKNADPLYRFVQHGKAGYIDQTGKVIIAPKFDAYGNGGDEFHDGRLAIGFSDGRYADRSGKLVINKGFYRGWDFSEGLAVAMQKDGDKWGYIDRHGNFVISPRFDTHPKGYVYSFADGLAMIRVSDRYGYIDRSGEFVIQPKFLHGTAFSEGMTRVVISGPCQYLDDSPCPEVKTLGVDSYIEGAPFCKFTFIDKSGTLITTEQYDRTKKFAEGFAPVRVGGKWGFIDRTGRMIIEPKFDQAEPFSNGLARIQQGKLYGYVDYNGTFVISPQFAQADDFSDGLAPVSKSWNQVRFGYEDFYYIDKQGKQAIAEKYASASHFFKGLAHVRLKAKTVRNHPSEEDEESIFAYINTSGARVFTYKGDR